MALDVTLETKTSASNVKIGIITLSGDLDASTAPTFKTEVEKAANEGAKRLVLKLSGLNYMASAGLRVLIFSKQKMGTDVDIYVVAPQEGVLDTLEKTGFIQGVILLEKDEPEKYEQ
ncbi:anti-sigma factor antagonist [Planktothrix sp. FACHB-1355]|uniref:Anti-sigma factor antagonist n=1 Tax=Aerosakkonema funiforme FACHB-1375 TaxID=2949571 RepID=A0A926ZEH2_9CYAN|nr:MULTISPECIES: anti-sigma factor antagonist [Oscillatoriales]MBD2179765.1 anti-sigma factor antagonist [Aerosakkonema funiforme FACHB-1375]MBD3559357.1 anti-sigma factor antagonist [Planktothrix sp. FACHB-1355]